MRGTAKITCPSRELPKKVLLANRDETEVEWYVPWRTCRFEPGDDGLPVCSVCGRGAGKHDCVRYRDVLGMHYEYKGLYCPNCGARVVSE